MTRVSSSCIKNGENYIYFAEMLHQQVAVISVTKAKVKKN